MKQIFFTCLPRIDLQKAKLNLLFFLCLYENALYENLHSLQPRESGSSLSIVKRFGVFRTREDCIHFAL